MKIAISQGSGDWKYVKYAPWLLAIDPHIEAVDLSVLPQSDAINALNVCDGLLLTGGPDVHPSLYKQEGRLTECKVNKKSIERDTREKEYLRIALEKNMPILGICRGMQLLSVYFGEGLVVDIPSDVPNAKAHKKSATEDATHEILFLAASPLASVGEQHTVNSSHHQSVLCVPTQFLKVAESDDGVIEAMIGTDALPSRILAVQWHPERMPHEDLLSVRVARFLLA